MRDLTRQIVSIDNISELGSIRVADKEHIIEATLMGDFKKVDTIVQEIKPQRSTEGEFSCNIR